jgi:endogenous inhibitor of DNA gyrase (YacG/DUF329 family)
MNCPICGKQFDPSKSPAAPFCSERCRTIDLGRWLGESYSVPHVRDPEADPEAEPPPETNGDG